MMKATLTFTTASLIFAAMSLHGAMLPGTELKDFPANPEKHVVTIKREAENETGKKMIQAAESAQPDTGKWWSAKDDEDVPVMGLKPYALTADTVNYYAEQIERYRKTAWKRRIHEPSSRLDYAASVALKDAVTVDGKEFKNVYVVTMKMTFQTSLTDMAFGGINFQKQRTVVLDTDGKVLAISGDKEEGSAMWMM